MKKLNKPRGTTPLFPNQKPQRKTTLTPLELEERLIESLQKSRQFARIVWKLVHDKGGVVEIDENEIHSYWDLGLEFKTEGPEDAPTRNLLVIKAGTKPPESFGITPPNSDTKPTPSNS